MSTTTTERRNVRLARAIVDDGRHKYLIAAAVPMSANVLGGILSGRVQPTAQQQERLADILGHRQVDLFGEVS